MEKITVRDNYLKNVNDFIDYLVNVISGDIEISHGYYDRTLKECLIFQTLNNAFEKYHWERNDYDTNKIKLKVIQNGLLNAKTDQDFYNACDKCLEWGAGGKGASLYINNMKWIDKHFPDATGLKDNITDASKNLILKNPVFTDFGNVYRMNAGFTKIYALYNKDYIIYDGRVGAAFGYLASRYGRSEKLHTLPEALKFPYGAAKGKQNRNPSTKDTIYKFTLLSNNKKHAQWNVRANWILTEAVKRARGFAGYKGQEALRAVEAALFMVGYDFPDLENSSLPLKNDTKKTKTLSAAVKNIVDILINGDDFSEFAPKHILAKANTIGSVITAEQIRSVLLRDCINSGNYYSGGKGYYKKIKRGVYKKII